MELSYRAMLAQWIPSWKILENRKKDIVYCKFMEMFFFSDCLNFNVSCAFQFSAILRPVKDTFTNFTHISCIYDLPQGTDCGNKSAFSIYRKWPLTTYAHGYVNKQLSKCYHYREALSVYNMYESRRVVL